MKGFLLSILSLTSLFSFSQKTDFSLTVFFKLSSQPKQIIIYQNDELKADTLIYPENDTLQYNGTISKPGTFQIRCDSSASVGFWIDNIPLSFTLSEIVGRRILKISDLNGSQDAVLLYKMTEPRNFPLVKGFSNLSREAKDSALRAADRVYYNIIDSLFVTNPNSPILPFYIRLYERILGPETVSIFYNRLSAELQASERGGKIREFLERCVLLEKGAVVENFPMENPNGKKLSLHSVKAKYILLDFWASWCGPCRAENPQLIQVYKKFKDKGFEIIGISLDENREDWMKAIKKDNLDWLHVSKLKGWNNELTAKYKISSLPFSILLDSNYKVIGSSFLTRDLEGILHILYEKGSLQ
jgi:thiol-disulfide isomerase/thioredoxin